MSTLADYLADKPRLREAVATLERLAPDIEVTNERYAAARADGDDLMREHMELANLERQVHDVQTFAELPNSSKAKFAPIEERARDRRERDEALREHLNYLLGVIEYAFTGTEGDAGKAIAGGYWWHHLGSGYGMDLAGMRKEVSMLDLKAKAQRQRDTIYALPNVAHGDEGIVVGAVLFIRYPYPELRRVVRITPTGRVRTESLHNKEAATFTPQHWPHVAKIVPQAIAEECMELHWEWQRREGEKGE